MLSRTLSACLTYVLLCAAAAHARVTPPSAPVLRTAIPAQSVDTAIASFGQITGLNVGGQWPPEIGARQSHGARSGLKPAEALTQLLHGTGLTFEFLNERTVQINYPGAAAHGKPEPTPVAPPLPEVVVTTPRWEDQVKRLPIDIDHWSPERSEASGVKGIADIAALAPGVHFDFFSTVGSGVYTNIILRGITDRHGSATGIFFDDVPLPAARSNTFGRALPPYFDLLGTDVLKGPQGTMLGAYTQGGAVRFTPNQPSLTTVSGLAHAEWAMTERGDPSFEMGAAAGGPLVENVLGYRFSAWYRTEGGYVDRVNPFTLATVDANANRDTNRSLRGALTFAPTDSVQISPSVNYVYTSAHDSPSFYTYLSDPSAGRLDNGSLLQQPFTDKYYVGSVRVIGDLSVGELDSRTSYYHRQGDLAVDDTESVKWGGWGIPGKPAYPVSYDNAVTTFTALRQSVFSQELRLSAPAGDSPTNWTVGLSYYRTRDDEAYHVVAANIPRFGGLPLDASNSTATVETQLAAFGQLSRTVDHFTFGAGLRVEHEDYDAAQALPVAIMPLPPQPAPAMQAHDTETIAAPKFSLAYESDRHDQYYLLAAKGYAPAGVDAALPTCLANMSAYPSDTVWSYEMGAHLGFDDGRASLNAVVFDARWNNGPLLSTNCLVTHIPGTAVSRGFELKARAPLGQLQARLEVSYTDAHYTETVSNQGRIISNDGDAVGTPPLVASPWNALATLERTFPLGADANATLRAEDAYHSHNPGPFYTSIPQPPGFNPNFYAPGLAADPAINLLNLRATVHLRTASPVPLWCRCTADNQDIFDISVFLNNALDSQPTLLKRNKGADLSDLYYATTFRPRTLGLSGTWRF